MLLDLGGLGLLISQMIGRWGNFINREAYGTDGLLFKMGIETASGVTYYHPTFLYESVWNLMGFLLLHFYSKKRKYDGEIFTLYVAWYGLGRGIIEGLRTDSLYFFGSACESVRCWGLPPALWRSVCWFGIWRCRLEEAGGNFLPLTGHVEWSKKRRWRPPLQRR